jgi:hypothetical protein
LYKYQSAVHQRAASLETASPIRASQYLTELAGEQSFCCHFTVHCID